MRNLVPHDKRIRVKGKPLVVGSMTQVYYEPVDPSFGRKAWITHFKGESGWRVAGRTTEHCTASSPGVLSHESTLKKADAIEAAARFIVHGYFYL